MTNSRPILAAFLFCLILCTGVLVCSYGRKEKVTTPVRTNVDTSFSAWWTKTRNSEKHKKAIGDTVKNKSIKDPIEWP